MIIYAGLQTLSSHTNVHFRNVFNWEIHPNYYSLLASPLNDIVVIKLTSSFDKNNNVGLCCLPSRSTSLPILNENAMIIGWEHTIQGDSSSLSDNLLQAVIQIQDSLRYCNTSSTSDI